MATLLSKVEDASRRESAQITACGTARGLDQEAFDVGQVRFKLQNELPPFGRLLGIVLGSNARGRRCWRSVLEHYLGPSLEHVVRDVQFPVDREEKGNLILVDFLGVETRDFAPGSGGVVSVLKVFRGQDQCSKKHAAPTLKCTIAVTVFWLFCGKIMFRNVGFNEDEIIQRDLERGVAGAGAAQGLLDEGAQRQDSFAAELVAAHGRG